MKKLLLLALAAAASAEFAVAQSAEPVILEDYCLVAVSPDGKWAVSCDEMNNTFAIVDLVNNKTFGYTEEEMMSAGLGHCVSNTGVVVASSMGYESRDQPYYWENGQWHLLPISADDYGAFPQAVTPDGSRIVGSVLKRAISVDESDVMSVPVVWDRNAGVHMTCTSWLHIQTRTGQVAHRSIFSSMTAAPTARCLPATWWTIPVS